MAENKEFKSLMKGLEESLEYAKGDKSKARKMSVTVTDNINKENSMLAKELTESDSLKKNAGFKFDDSLGGRKK